MEKTQLGTLIRMPGRFESKLMIIPFFLNLFLKKSAENKNYLTCRDIAFYYCRSFYNVNKENLKANIYLEYSLNTLMS